MASFSVPNWDHMLHNRKNALRPHVDSRVDLCMRFAG